MRAPGKERALELGRFAGARYRRGCKSCGGLRCHLVAIGAGCRGFLWRRSFCRYSFLRRLAGGGGRMRRALVGMRCAALGTFCTMGIFSAMGVLATLAMTLRVRAGGDSRRNRIVI